MTEKEIALKSAYNLLNQGRLGERYDRMEEKRLTYVGNTN